MVLRMFDTAVAPEDLELCKQLFEQQAKPAFEGFAGCHGIELFVGVEEHSQDLIDVAAISRWDSLADIEDARSSAEYDQALAELKKLFAQTPIVRHFVSAES